MLTALCTRTWLNSVLLGAILVASSAVALDWDPAHSASGTGSGGGGTWYPSSVNWYPGSGSANQVWTSGGTAVFAGNPGYVILNSTRDGGVNAGSVSLLNNSYFFENASYTGSATHTIGTFNFGTGLFVYNADYNGTAPSIGDIWNVQSVTHAQGTAVMFYMNNLGLYKNENSSIFRITDRSSLGTIGKGDAFFTGAPNFTTSVVPYIVYAKFMHLPFYNFVGYDSGNNTLRALVTGAENNNQQYGSIDGSITPDFNIRLGTSVDVSNPATINSLVLDGCGYNANSTANITGNGTITINSGGILYLRAPENFSNPVVFPNNIEGHIFVGNGYVWTNNQRPFSPNIRSAFSGTNGLTITGQPDTAYVYPDSATIVYNPDPITLSGNSTYTGTTTINAAKVITGVPANFGASSMIVLNAGATLAPSADNFLSTTQSLTMNPGSELAGHNTAAANLVFGSGSTGVTLHSSTQLKPSGAVQLNGATLNFVLDAAPAGGQKYTLVSGASSITGTFAQGSTLTASFGGTPHTFGINYSGGSIVLTEGAGYTGTPFGNGGNPWPIPGVIDTDNYDNGGQNISFYSSTPNPYHYSPADYRSDEMVHIASYGGPTPNNAGNGFAFGSHGGGGNWMKYTVNVTKSGTYNVEFVYANADDLSHFHLEFDGNTVGSIAALPTAGNWATYVNGTTITGINLTAGTHVLRFFVENGDTTNAGMALPYLNFVFTGSAAGPTITTQPANQTVTAGQTASFSVAASGTGTLSYQWTRNGTNISGATSSFYTTPVTTTADSGANFAVVVSDSTGSVTSNNATLTVNPVGGGPTITTQPASQTVTAGQTATFSVVAGDVISR